jgi:hypothetical protein
MALDGKAKHKDVHAPFANGQSFHLLDGKLSLIQSIHRAGITPQIVRSEQHAAQDVVQYKESVLFIRRQPILTLPLVGRSDASEGEHIRITYKRSIVQLPSEQRALNAMLRRCTLLVTSGCRSKSSLPKSHFRKPMSVV